MRHKVLSRFTLLLILWMSPGLICFAQTDGYQTSSNARGIVPFGSYHAGEIDNINLGAGTLNVRIPLTFRKGRGLDEGRFLSYSSKIWVGAPYYGIWGQIEGMYWIPRPYESGSFQLASLHGEGISWTENYASAACQEPVQQQNWHPVLIRSNFVYTSSEGGQHRFPVRLFWTESTTIPQCANLTEEYMQSITKAPSDSGAMDLELFEGLAKVRFKDGREFTQPFQPLTGSVKDTSGNFINLGGQDTLGRSYNYQGSAPGGGITVYDSSGNPQSYSFQYSNLLVTPQFPTTNNGSGFTFHWNSWQTVQVLSRVTLPDGRFYAFTYDPVFGELVRINLPSGGYIRYVYSTLPQFDQGPDFVPCYIDSRRITERYVSPDGVTEHRWSYAYQRGTNDTYITRVTDPFNNDTVHFFQWDGIHEFKTDYYSGSSLLLKSIQHDWDSDFGPVQADQEGQVRYGSRNWRVTATTTKLLDNGLNLWSRTETIYDEFTTDLSPIPYSSFVDTRMTVKQFLEYDFGNGVWGLLRRKTTTDYLHEVNTAYRNAHIWDRVTLRKVFDGQNLTNPKAQTEYRYDTTTLSTTSGVIQHDYQHNNYIPRGNLTETRRWLNSPDSWLSTMNWYDDLGNVVMTRDARGRDTSFTYHDDFRRAYVTRIARPAAQGGAAQETTRRWYYFYSGMLQSETDPRNQVTSYQYDRYDRPTLITRPDEGSTQHVYNDVSRLIDTHTSIDSQQTLHQQERYDALGRLLSSMTFNASDGNTIVDRQYDGLGRLWKVTNPYAEGGAQVWTVTEYDPLDRINRVISPSGAVVETAYIGNAVRVSDPALKKRESTQDGLGRVILVREDPDGKNYQTAYGYDALDNLVQVSQAGQVRQFGYDSLSRLSWECAPESGFPSSSCGVTSYAYDGNDNLNSRVDPRGVLTLYGYDDLNRLISKTFSGPVAAPSVAYVYGTAAGDGLSFGRLKSATASGASLTTTYTYAYDGMGQVIQQGVAFSTVADAVLTTSYTYNRAGLVVATQYPSGRVVNQNYDDAALLRSVSSSRAVTGTYVNNMRYWAHGALKTGSYGNGRVYGPSAYDLDLRPTYLGVAGVMDLTMSYSRNAPNNGNVQRVWDGQTQKGTSTTTTR